MKLKHCRPRCDAVTTEGTPAIVRARKRIGDGGALPANWQAQRAKE
jgi:hypothetical protein